MIWHGSFSASARELGTHREPAQALVVAGLLLGLVLLPVIGLGVDAELIFSAHRRLEMLADGAARVGAMQLDPATSYARQQASLDTAGGSGRGSVSSTISGGDRYSDGAGRRRPHSGAS
jgi:uncharacterized membrane protein